MNPLLYRLSYPAILKQVLVEPTSHQPLPRWANPPFQAVDFGSTFKIKALPQIPSEFSDHLKVKAIAEQLWLVRTHGVEPLRVLSEGFSLVAS